MGGGMWFFWVILLAVVAYAAYTIAAQKGVGPGDQTEKTAEDIVKERYARGEIDKEEYEQKLQDLRT